MFGVSHGAIQFMTYEEMKNKFNEYRGLPIDTKMVSVRASIRWHCNDRRIVLNIVKIVHLQGTGEYLAFAALSKLIAAAVTYPYQVVRARLQDQNHSYAGTWDCVKKTWRYERMPGFYKGLAPYLLHVMPNICLVMIIYEKFANT